MQDTADDHSRHVQRHQRDGGVGDDFVNVLQPLRAYLVEHGPATQTSDSDHNEQPQHRPACRGIVAGVVLRRASDERTQVREHGARRPREAREAGIAGPQHAPQQAKCNEARGRVAEQGMQRAPAFALADQIGAEERGGEQPVKKTRGQVPDEDAVLNSGGHGRARFSASSARRIRRSHPAWPACGTPRSQTSAWPCRRSCHVTILDAPSGTTAGY